MKWSTTAHIYIRVCSTKICDCVSSYSVLTETHRYIIVFLAAEDKASIGMATEMCCSHIPLHKLIYPCLYVVVSFRDSKKYSCSFLQHPSKELFSSGGQTPPYFVVIRIIVFTISFILTSDFVGVIVTVIIVSIAHLIILHVSHFFCVVENKAITFLSVLIPDFNNIRTFSCYFFDVTCRVISSTWFHSDERKTKTVERKYIL